ncbi:MAG: UDP-N-acetylmuramate dehydrogenase [Proteobacteria bacterium]|nr:UDP-N-acetylmuramate dehydrogenase [Pseudomonadota bacterium]
MKNLPMSGHTTFKVGGKADLMVYPGDAEELGKVICMLKDEGLPFLMLGSGSNLLVSDEGLRGAVISLKEGFRNIEIADELTIDCGAGLSLGVLVNFAAGHALSGIEFLSGIPGTVGGALWMNAGAFGSEIKDVIASVSFADSNGDLKNIGINDLPFSYRKLDVDPRCVVTGCRLVLEKGDESIIREKIRSYATRRAESQPLGRATAGSVFKNPPGDFAGRLIEDAGMKGVHMGKAKVSEKHANFIENTGGASARDIFELMRKVAAKVFESSGIQLEPEVKIVGEGLGPWQ